MCLTQWPATWRTEASWVMASTETNCAGGAGERGTERKEKKERKSGKAEKEGRSKKK